MLLRNILRRWLLLMQLLSSAVQLCPYGKSGTDVVHLTEECDQGILSWKSSYSIEEVILEYTCDNSSTTKNITAGTIRATTSSSYSSIPIDGQECTYFGCVVEEYGDPTHLLNTVTCTKKPSPTATATTPTPQSMITPTAFNNARTTQFLTTQTVRASTFTITPTTLQNVRSVSVNMLEGSPTVVGEPKKVVTSLFLTSGSNETSRSGSGSLGMTLWSSSVGPQEPINSSEGNSQLIAITSTALEVEFKDISRTSILAMLSTLISLVIISVIILLFSLTMRLYIIRLRTQKITERQKIGLPLSSVHKLLDIVSSNNTYG